MTTMRWPAAVAAVLAMALICALPAGADAKTKLYKFTIAGKLHMDWQWPANQFNNGQRDSDTFDVLGGSGCGSKPTRARWKIRIQNGGLPAQTLIVDFIFGGAKNPAELTHAYYPGTPQADMPIFMKFGSLKAMNVKLVAKPTGDILGPNINPAKAKLTKRRVKKCKIS